jgi:hypothetical protein
VKKSTSSVAAALTLAAAAALAGAGNASADTGYRWYLYANGAGYAAVSPNGHYGEICDTKADRRTVSATFHFGSAPPFGTDYSDHDHNGAKPGCTKHHFRKAVTSFVICGNWDGSGVVKCEGPLDVG